MSAGRFTGSLVVNEYYSTINMSTTSGISGMCQVVPLSAVNGSSHARPRTRPIYQRSGALITKFKVRAYLDGR